ncbi:hypothetical protein FRB99_000022 [Tulasnella sp. 403]|nr:hypothetical protein FRB99_000022 [Tulasnella sp. 403]
MSNTQEIEQSGSLPHEPQLLLPPPEKKDGAQDVELGTTFKFNELGPMIVNSDGTLSRIANWDKMTELEKQRTYRVLNARNRIRLEDQKAKQASEVDAQEVSS